MCVDVVKKVCKRFLRIAKEHKVPREKASSLFIALLLENCFGACFVYIRIFIKNMKLQTSFQGFADQFQLKFIQLEFIFAHN